MAAVTAVTGRMRVALERLIVEERPDLVVVRGDATSTLAGEAAYPGRSPSMRDHVLTTGACRRSTRVLTDQISALLLCPTEAATGNLRLQGIGVGVRDIVDVMCDPTLFATATARCSRMLDCFGLVERSFAVTASKAPRYSRFLWDKRRTAWRCCRSISEQRQRIEQWNLDRAGIMNGDRIGYLDMRRVLQNGISGIRRIRQIAEGTYLHRTPCVTLRNETQWVETKRVGHSCEKGRSMPRGANTDACGYGGGAAKAVALIVDPLKCQPEPHLNRRPDV